MLTKMARNKLVWLYGFFALAYLVLTFTTPVDPDALAKYSMTTSQAKILTLTIVIPVILIWIAALVGFLRFSTYAELIKKSKDGEAFRMIAQGILWLGLWLPISTLVGALTKRYYDLHPETTASLVRLDNYINLLIIIPGFVLVYLGSQKLLPLVKKPKFSPSQLLVAAYIIFSALYVLLTLHDPARHFPMTSDGIASYYQPDWLLVTTLVIPRLLVWAMGAQAVHNIYMYRTNVKGTLYKSALNNLAFGIGGVIVSVILLRCLQSVSSTLTDASLGFLLGVIYVLLLVMSIGYIYIAKGAQNLQKLEEF